MVPRFALGACFGSTRLILGLKNGWWLGWDQPRGEEECSVRGQRSHAAADARRVTKDRRVLRLFGRVMRGKAGS